ncbi:universal stress protein [Myceligenerans indicum]|uniref:Universal stress protein n=1 Tax=Myceligenerans indicum TaxID=2593663 RepID=A0ABS1LIL1_9MICO|nr:universal stress protein [Myceligenerans indicum]MBL0885998.1 universal stress protein [Myceligenerans indicum]
MSGAAPGVVVAVDGRRTAGAIRYAIQEARARGTGVRLVHVLSDHGCPSHEIMDPGMSQTCADATDVTFDWLLERGSRTAELVETTTAAGLLVLGRLPREDTGKPVLGAVTTEVAARATGPVVVVPADWQGLRYRRVVAGVKSCAYSGKLLATAFSAADTQHAVLRVVHARGHVGEETMRLEALVRDWSAAFPDVAVETSFPSGDAAPALVRAALDADVVLVARHHRDLRHLARLGPVPRAVLAAADTPVEVVPLGGAPVNAPVAPARSRTILQD